MPQDPKAKLKEFERKLREAKRLARGKQSAADQYARHKEAMREQRAEQSARGRGISPPRPPENPARREESRHSLRRFCELYFPETFSLPWSDDHHKVIAKTERAVLEGGLFGMAMPRGSGKTALATTSAVWAVLHAHRRYVCLIAATAKRGQQLLGSVKTRLRFNPLLRADFDYELRGIVELEGVASRCNGQHFEGVPTQIEWGADKIVFPTMPGSQASGAILTSAGLTAGDIRGQFHVEADGQTVRRPDLIIPDDPQTRESAASVTQTETRHKLLMGDVLLMAGPNVAISGVMPITVIEPDDLADRVLDRTKSPDWQGERTKMVYSFPNREDLWEKYADIRHEALCNDGNFDAATEFYRQNREAMDEGAQVAWPERCKPGEISGLQSAMNLKYRDEVAFWAECQNEPLNLDLGDDILTPEQVVGRALPNLQRGVVPLAAQFMTMFIDVHKEIHYYVVKAFEPDFTGHVVEYGAWPEQKREYFAHRDVRRTLSRKYPQAGIEGAVYAGLDALVNMKLGREWKQEGGAALRIGICVIDANWGEMTDVVYRFCRESQHAANLMPSHGKGIKASSEPLVKPNDKPKPGDRPGLQWRVRTGKRRQRYVVFDTNFWKSFTHHRYLVPQGDPGGFFLHAGKHNMLADQLTAEYPVQVEAKGRVVSEWKQRPDHPDNHWFDCDVGCSVAASILGVKLAEHDGAKPRRKEKVKLSDLQARKRGGR